MNPYTIKLKLGYCEGTITVGAERANADMKLAESLKDDSLAPFKFAMRRILSVTDLKNRDGSLVSLEDLKSLNADEEIISVVFWAINALKKQYISSEAAAKKFEIIE